ncbi:MAG: GNAT family N-acetyltransferase [Angelakisella sp.]|nr:GNAT family N-acetyltransferase [Angelakisella sp.]
MEIINAEPVDFKEVKRITQFTIMQIYPHYYPTGVVEFFREHHNDNNIMTDIINGKVYIFKDVVEYVGTVTIDGNEINRLFVLPKFQKKGYGTAIMDFAENKIFENYPEIQLHASLPGKKLYIKRAYFVVEYRTKMVTHDDWICIDIMEKYRP